jgi:hypothetical protein
VYVGQTGKTIKTWHKKHMRHIHLGKPEKSAVAEHKFEKCHNQFSNTSVLDKAPNYMNHLIKEGTEIKLHPRLFNRDENFSLNWSWNLVINIIKQY